MSANNVTIQERTEEIYWELEFDQNLLVGDYMLLNLKSGHYFLLNLETNTFKEYTSASEAIAAIPEKDQLTMQREYDEC